ncbi:RNA polymerase sigma factor [compost metagenome]
MREVFVMSRKLQMSHKEIAEELGIEETTVKRQVSNALKILRVKLGLLLWLMFLIKY